jgi:hypothetical protein
VRFDHRLDAITQRQMGVADDAGSNSGWCVPRTLICRDNSGNPMFATTVLRVAFASLDLLYSGELNPSSADLIPCSLA